MAIEKFSGRHIGPRESDVNEMLSICGASSIDELIEQTIPNKIRLASELNLSEPLSEFEYLNHSRELAQKNKLYKKDKYNV